MLKKIFILFYFLLSSYVYASNTSLEKVSIQLKWFYQYQFAGVIMAKEKGFYEDAGLDVSLKERDPKFNNIAQVINGDSEYGIADSAILKYRAGGSPVKVLATIFQHNAMVLIAKRESGIISPYEMRGKKISYQEGLDDSIVTSLLNFAKIEKDNYIKKPMDFSHMDFVNGDVDITEAYISIEPYWMKEKHGIDLNIIDPKNYGIDFYGDLLFTTEDEIKNHPKRVKAFTKATLKGWKYALKHKEESIKIILDKYNTRTLEYKQLLYEARITDNLISSNYIPLGQVRKERFKTIASMYAKKGLSEEKLIQATENLIYSIDKKEKTFSPFMYILFFVLLILVTLVIRFYFAKKESQRKLQELIALAQKQIIMTQTDLDGSITYVSEPFCKLSGFVEGEIIGKNHKIIRHPDMPHSVYRELWSVIQSGKSWEGEVLNMAKDKSAYWVHSYITPIKDKKGKVTSYQSIQHDITNKKKIEKMSITDGLTHLYNRRYFDDMFKKEINNAKRNKTKLVFSMIDIDNFKKYNDMYGHKKGDDALVSVATTIRQSFQRSGDMVFRLGGEEFGVLFSITNEDDVLQLVEQARANIQNLRIEHKENTGGVITASFGVLIVDNEYKNNTEKIIHDTYVQADEALYKAKNSGRNKVIVAKMYSS